ncbi:hypothetical protein RF11_13746 [Thelohanellus kitauei]|uniref:Uncharacterized protein n=1 Tax=Thelohanellus kitauei TaxID=669202 RepID=A0A0C2J0X5_THEKT|nr:hypothetical protein RF11_13746 [Thelohanellus kitauei]
MFYTPGYSWEQSGFKKMTNCYKILGLNQTRLIGFAFHKALTDLPPYLKMTTYIAYRNPKKGRHVPIGTEKIVYHLQYHSDKCNTTLTISNSLNPELEKEFLIYLSVGAYAPFFSKYRFTVTKITELKIHCIYDYHSNVELFVIFLPMTSNLLLRPSTFYELSHELIDILPEKHKMCIKVMNFYADFQIVDVFYGITETGIVEVHDETYENKQGDFQLTNVVFVKYTGPTFMLFSKMTSIRHFNMIPLLMYEIRIATCELENNPAYLVEYTYENVSFETVFMGQYNYDKSGVKIYERMNGNQELLVECVKNYQRTT